jgi:SAM-dependent methyltransferase
MELVLPAKTDYPDEVFRADLPPELRVGCAYAYFKANALIRRTFRRRVQLAFSMLPPGQRERALDAGTGAGFLLPMLAVTAKEVVGVDLSPVLRYTQSMLDKRGLHNVRLEQADLLHLPFPDGNFDLVMCMSVIEHMPDPAEACAELARVLRPGGILILGYPLEHILMRVLVFFGRTERKITAFLRGESQPKGEPFHPHVSDKRRIEQGWKPPLYETGRRNVRLVGIPVYRIIRLEKKA